MCAQICEVLRNATTAPCRQTSADVVVWPTSGAIANTDSLTDGLFDTVVQHLMHNQGPADSPPLAVPSRLGPSRPLQRRVPPRGAGGRPPPASHEGGALRDASTTPLPFTGSEVTIRSMRVYADKRMSLSLSDAGPLPKGTRPRERVCCAPEADVDAHLDLRYFRVEGRTRPVVPLEQESMLHARSDLEGSADDEPLPDDYDRGLQGRARSVPQNFMFTPVPTRGA